MCRRCKVSMKEIAENNMSLSPKDYMLHPNVADRIMEWVDSGDVEMLGVPEEWTGNVKNHLSQIYSAIEMNMRKAQRLTRLTTTFDEGDRAVNGVFEWYNMGFGTILSNGIKGIIERNKSFWFIDIISSYCKRLRSAQDNGGFYVCYAIPEGSTCHILITDGGREAKKPDDIFVYQFVPYTGLKKPLKFYLSLENKNLILTPSEYC